MSADELEDYQVAQLAAKIARIIRSKPDRDTVEYGAIIYRGVDGIITHGEVTQGNATGVAASTVGLPGWGSALAIVHSHHATLYNPSYPYFRLHPTPGGDWNSRSHVQSMMVEDLMNSKQYTHDAAWAQAYKLSFYILGASGPVGTDKYELGRYGERNKPYQNHTSQK